MQFIQPLAVQKDHPCVAFMHKNMKSLIVFSLFITLLVRIILKDLVDPKITLEREKKKVFRSSSDVHV